MKWVISCGSVVLVLAVGALFFYVPETREYVRAFSPVDRNVEIIFGGDIMLDRSIRLAMEREGEDHVFSCIKDLLLSVDLVVANLEGPITSYPSKSTTSKVGEPDNFTFTFATSTAALLARHNISLLNLGNNHIFNFGREGLAQTKQWLDGAGVKYFGDPDLPEDERVERLTKNRVKLSFVNWSDWTSDKTDHTVAQVRKEKEAGRIVVVYTHWGEEYVPATSRMKQLAHSFIDAGAEVVIGSHPHIVQEHEVYAGKHIYYSLGNFLFDQYWNKEVRRGLLLKITFTPEGSSSIEEIPIDNQNDRRMCVV